MINKYTLLNDVKLLSGETNEELIYLMIDQAEEFIINFCHFPSTKDTYGNVIPPIIPDGLKGTWTNLAVYKLNHLGKDNLTSESLGSYSSSFTDDIPKPITNQLKQFRLLRVI